jgi:hypothetical protein
MLYSTTGELMYNRACFMGRFPRVWDGRISDEKEFQGVAPLLGKIFSLKGRADTPCPYDVM